MKQIIILFITALLVAGTGMSSFAGNDDDKNESKTAMTTSLKGQVVDKETGESLTGVKVEIKDSEKEAYTDFEGNFKFSGIKAGKYEIVASYISYKKKSFNNVKLELNDNNQVTLKLKSLEE